MLAHMGITARIMEKKIQISYLYLIIPKNMLSLKKSMLLYWWHCILCFELSW